MGYSAERTPLTIRRLYILAVLLAVAVIPALVIDLPVSAWFRRTGFPDEMAKMFRLAEAGREREVVEPSDRRVFVVDAKDTVRIRTGQGKIAT